MINITNTNPNFSNTLEPHLGIGGSVYEVIWLNFLNPTLQLVKYTDVAMRHTDFFEIGLSFLSHCFGSQMRPDIAQPLTPIVHESTCSNTTGTNLCRPAVMDRDYGVTPRSTQFRLC